jgi:hypothetical protein
MTAPKKATGKKVSGEDLGVFTAAEVDVRVLWVRWDSVKNSPVLNLGNVDPWTALAWLQAAVDLAEIVAEDMTMDGEEAE